MAIVTSRIDVLDALAESREKRELVEELNVSRSTVDRALRELESLDLATRDGEYHLTVRGELVLEAFRGFLAEVQDLVAAGELLAYVPRDAPMSLVMLRDATVEVAEPPSPTEALDPVLSLLRTADRGRGLSVAATRPQQMIELFEERVDTGISFEHVFSETMVEYLTSEYTERLRRLMAAGNFEAFVFPELPYGLGLVDTPDGRTAFLALYDDDHAIRGVVLNDSTAAYEWAEDVYLEYRSDAERLPPP